MNFKSIGNKIKGNPKMIEGTVYSMLIICGILGAAPFAIALPFVNFTWTIICTFLSGLIIASAFSSIVVYATDLMPDKVGLIAGIFFGLMFGLGGLGSAFFGWLADKTSVEFIFQVSAFLHCSASSLDSCRIRNRQKTVRRLKLRKHHKYTSFTF